MAYSDSMHFSDKISYKTHFIPGYSLEDMNFVRSHTCRNFLEKKTEKDVRLFSPSER
jgi:hypothetical protein